MTIRHLLIFLKVYQLGNITKAAEALYMSQPAVTRAIKEIENYYGITLFDRINKRIYPTKVCDNFYEYAVHIIDSFNQMEKSLTDSDNLGIIKIGTTIAIGNSVLPIVLKNIKKKYPNIEFKIKVANGEIIEKDLIDNKLDFGVIEGEVLSNQLRKEKVFEDYLVPILSPKSKYKNKKIDIEELINENLILREKGSVGRNLVESIFNLKGLKIDPIMESESTQAIIKAVHEDIGYSFLPLSMIKKQLDNKEIASCSLNDVKLKRNNYIVWHKHKLLSKIAKEVMNEFKNELNK